LQRPCRGPRGLSFRRSRGSSATKTNDARQRQELHRRQQATTTHTGSHQVHAGRLELEVRARADKNALAEGFKAAVFDELADRVVIDAGAQGAKEVDRLVRERVHERLNLAAVEVVVLEDTEADADAVLARRVPVVLLHAPVTDERCIQRTEVVACSGPRRSNPGPSET
jgi:hypothetical protein